MIVVQMLIKRTSALLLPMRLLLVRAFHSFNKFSISVCTTGRCLITIPQMMSSDTASYPWIILFRVSTSFLEFVIRIVSSRFKILLIASPMISTFLSTALLVRKSVWYFKNSLSVLKKTLDFHNSIQNIIEPCFQIIVHTQAVFVD